MTFRVDFDKTWKSNFTTVLVSDHIEKQNIKNSNSKMLHFLAMMVCWPFSAVANFYQRAELWN